jgi:LPPG:FO 2-phospho-L-lactate transferase
MSIVCLAGGSGGAKLAAGLQDLVGSELAVIANTADDTEVHGLLVCPDPDLITYWLAGEIDEERGWGIRDDSFVVHERLQRLGAPGWFGLSDRDLATCIYRTHFIAEGGTLTAAQAQIARALGASARVLPMCEQPVRTRIRTRAGWRGLQEFLILDGGEAPIEGVELEGIAATTPTPDVVDTLAAAEAVILGPSNPVISIGPILAVPGMREAIAASPAKVVAVSPLVGGRAVKGPTDAFVASLGRPLTGAGIASLYAGVIDGIVVDEGDPGPDEIPVRSRPTLMEGPEGRRAVAAATLEFARDL